LRAYLAILGKDVRQELRTKEMITAMAVFALLVMLIFNFALGIGHTDKNTLAAAVLWVAFTFAGTLGLNRSMSQERAGESLRGLLLCPVDRSVIFLAKATANLIFMLAVELVAIPVAIILFNLKLVPSMVWLPLVLFLGSLGFATVGTVFATMATGTRARDWLLPLLLLPIEIPVIIGAVQATATILTGEPPTNAGMGFNLLVACDVIYLAVCYVLFEYAVEV
jgi:heme exporter protein B